MQKKFTFELAGRTITVETGKYAEQAGGAILISCGYTALLVCATVAKQAREGADFLPLSCDYEEKELTSSHYLLTMKKKCMPQAKFPAVL